MRLEIQTERGGGRRTKDGEVLTAHATGTRPAIAVSAATAATAIGAAVAGIRVVDVD